MMKLVLLMSAVVAAVFAVPASKSDGKLEALETAETAQGTWNRGWNGAAPVVAPNPWNPAIPAAGAWNNAAAWNNPALRGWVDPAIAARGYAGWDANRGLNNYAAPWARPTAAAAATPWAAGAWNAPRSSAYVAPNARQGWW